MKNLDFFEPLLGIKVKIIHIKTFLKHSSILFVLLRTAAHYLIIRAAQVLVEQVWIKGRIKSF